MSIKLEGINYIYGQGTEMVMHALKDINIEIKDGEFVGLIGGEALYSQQKQDQQLTVAQIMNSLLPNSD